ncbi:MAG: hypothetical protein L0027_03215 [Candidatus Rokubacteria bacterium]|nr:hypothetical protein [Candidatus Rokubacteria bacterium]
MVGDLTLRLVVGAAILAVLPWLSGCATVREVLALPGGPDPSVEIKAAEPRWLLIKNPRFDDVPSEPEYIWVEEDKVPTTMKTLVLGKSSILASPEIVAKYGSPPGGGRVSPRHGVPQALEPTPGPRSGVNPPRPAGGAGGVAPAIASTGPPVPTAGRAPAIAAAPPRGDVVYVDTTRVVIDLTSRDGVQAGTVVSLRRDKIPIVHPVTGELLGELDEELGTGKVTEVRDRFSVVELDNVAPGIEIKVKDRVVIR